MPTGSPLVLAYAPEGLTHEVDQRFPWTFYLGGFINPGQGGIAFHGTALEEVRDILRNGGRLEKGPDGDPYGVYHSEKGEVAYES